MTANGAWPEITENLFPGVSILFLIFYTQCLIIINHIGQSAVDRPDLVTQVFYAKQQALLRMIRDGYYGPVAGFVYTIEQRQFLRQRLLSTGERLRASISIAFGS